MAGSSGVQHQHILKKSTDRFRGMAQLDLQDPGHFTRGNFQIRQLLVFEQRVGEIRKAMARKVARQPPAF